MERTSTRALSFFSFMGILFLSTLTDFSLSGPLHGGANEAVIRMLISIGRSVFIVIIFVVSSHL
jgi:hypothetical protein